MSPLRIAVLDDYQGIAADIDWSSVTGGVEVEGLAQHVADHDELAARLEPFDVVVAMRERTAIDAGLLARLPNLRLIVTTGPSNAVIDVAAAQAQGVVVSGTGGYLTPTSEHTWALILALQRHVPAEDAAVRAGGWQHTLGRELAGRTLGLVGLGRLGALVAEVGKAFQMEVVAWSENLTDERAAEVDVRRVAKDELFATADVVSVHLVLSDRSRGLVGEPELRAMKPTAVLVNTSRGPIVDEAALVRALQEGWIAGAGLDVFDVEPLPADHPLRSLANTVLSPHVGYVTDGLYDLFFTEIVENVAAFAAGAPVRVVEP
jgi:phosphoglycerate dehydrogenase-like enzyme